MGRGIATRVIPAQAGISCGKRGTSAARDPSLRWGDGWGVVSRSTSFRRRPESFAASAVRPLRGTPAFAGVTVGVWYRHPRHAIPARTGISCGERGISAEGDPSLRWGDGWGVVSPSTSFRRRPAFPAASAVHPLRETPAFAGVTVGVWCRHPRHSGADRHFLRRARAIRCGRSQPSLG